MRKFMKYFMLTLVVSAFILAGCSKSDDDDTPTTPTVTTFETLTTYMVAEGLDVAAVFESWIVPPTTVNGKGIDDYFIIDIRSEESYNDGHIEGAVHSSLLDILSTAADAPGDKTILVACYTGQTAGHAVMALRLSGHSTAQVLKWGMSGWNDALAAKWEDNIGNAADLYGTWIAPPGEIVPNTEEFDPPALESAYTDGKDILVERVDSLLTGFNGIGNEPVLNNPLNYFINNYWPPEPVLDYGNITGAHSLVPFSLAGKTYKYIDPSKEVVSYCWTGQTSSMLTAYLYVLGYDALSLTFGVNGMIYDDLDDNDVAHKWFLQGNNFPVVPTK
jgi:rhodanese-related sulfurtransferase